MKGSGLRAQGWALAASPLAVASLVVSGFSRPRSNAARRRPPPTFRTEANYVRVDVYPTKDDAPVADLTQADFEVLEGGAPQKIEQFERVVIRGGVPQDTAARAEHRRAKSRAMAAQNPRARVFVLFLDINHVERRRLAPDPQAARRRARPPDRPRRSRRAS